MSGWVEFNIHDAVKFRVQAEAPTAALLKDMFSPFLTEGLDDYDLTIQSEYEGVKEGAFGEAHGETEFYYNKEGIHLEAMDIEIFVNENKFRLNGKSELLVWALPLIDRIMVTKGNAMLHALTVEYKGKGLLIPAWGGSGKTSTMAKLVKMDGFAFMGDDWTFLSRDGRLLAYAKPMFIKPYHNSIYPHLFKKTHKPLVPARLSSQIHSMTTRVHPYVTRYPKIAALIRRWSPEHMMVTPRNAFPEASFSNGAPLAASLFVERFETSSTTAEFSEQTSDWMVSRVIGNFFSELPRQSRLAVTALGASGLVPIDKSFAEKAAVVSAGLENKPAFYLRIPKSLPPDQASDILVEHVQKVLQFIEKGQVKR